ncbi:phosphate signaling complex protein PhoU [Arthrobacter sp. BB-1]|uniref:phosphate signaling complex protein PhoU n=1 Tax=unclassified Arthrobacter TaxID=235627 RepID=UPI001111FAD5|nr:MULTISPECIES: phosphate signaling complex protein PhoU [unclassified Arthrobacter]TNB67706.1 phosphate signaling complex protein PhoU [Arthrobacter sp. BB-1]
MRKVFQAELHHIGEQLVEMSVLVHNAMEHACTALRTADLELAQEVIAADARIDFLQNALDERVIEILALQSPVATDLRTTVASLRMSASLERMGDLARHIAQLTRLRYPAQAIPERLSATFAELTDLDLAIAGRVTQLLTERDLDLVRQITDDKARINQLHAGVFTALAADDWDKSGPETVDVALASRYFERFADHGVSVARKVEYLVTGQWQPSTEAEQPSRS